MEKNIYREEYIKKLRNYKDKKIIKVLTGIRRSGKSTILNQFNVFLHLIHRMNVILSKSISNANHTWHRPIN